MKRLYILLIGIFLTGATSSIYGQVLQSVRLTLPTTITAELWKWLTPGSGPTLTIVADSNITGSVNTGIYNGGTLIASINSHPILLRQGFNIISGMELLSGGFAVHHDPNQRNYARQIGQENRLLAGQYELCSTVSYFEASHFSDSVSFRTCRRFTIISYRPPRITGPRNDEPVLVDSRPRFDWAPVTPPAAGIQYEFRLVEVFPEQTASDAFEGNWGASYETTTSLTSIFWPSVWSPPELGKQYVWSVRAIDDSGLPLSLPNGWTEPSVFRVVTDAPPLLGYPRDSSVLKIEESGEISIDLSYQTEREDVWDLLASLRKSGTPSLSGLMHQHADDARLYRTGFGGKHAASAFPDELPDFPLPPSTDSAKDNSRRERFEWSFGPLTSDVVQYRFLIAVVARDQIPEEAIRDPKSVFFIDTTFHTYYLFKDLPPLEQDVQYAWSVQVVDLNGQPVSVSDTIAVPHMFTVNYSSGNSGDPNNNATETNRDTLLFENTAKDGAREIKPEKFMQRDTNIALHTDLLNSRDTLYAEFFEERIQVVLTAGKVTEEMASWTGKIVGEEESYILFVRYDSLVIGNILRNGKLYQIRDIGNGVHSLILIDPPRFSEPVAVPDVNPEEYIELPENYPLNDPPNSIDALVLYTDRAAYKAGGEPNVKAEILLAVEETNLSFLNSGIDDLRIELLEPQQIGYSETGHYSDDLDWLTYAPSVQLLRDSLRADIVVMLVGSEEKNSNGIAHTSPFPNPHFEKLGFAVVYVKAATMEYSFAHEIGHLLGCDHNKLDPDRHTDATDAFGYADTEAGFRTIMSMYVEGTSRIPRWSNPDRNYDGRPTGTRWGDSATYNARMIEQHRAAVSNYRSRSDTVTDVWMMDAWTDNGEQPWKHSSTVYPWRSPSILPGDLIRTADSDKKGVHEKPGHNVAVVKIRNGTDIPVHGRMELYVGTPSLTPQWDTSWRRVAFVDTVLPPKSRVDIRMRSAENSTNKRSAFLALWMPKSQAPYRLGSRNLIGDVLHSNKVVWYSQQNIRMRNQSRPPNQLTFKAIDGSTIEIVCERRSLNGQTFLLHSGTIRVKFDPRTDEVLQKSNGVSGAERGDSAQYNISDPDRAVFPITGSGSGRAGHLTIKFGSGRPNVNYLVHVLHRASDGSLLGGVSYMLDDRPEPSHRKQTERAREGS